MEDLIKRTNNSEYVAALDLGTNSNRLLVVDNKGQTVYRDVRHVALGEGLAENKCFCEKAMDRAICSYMDFNEMMSVYGVKKYRAIATAACRMSTNTKSFLEDVKKSSGIDVEVISEYEEARLTLKGAKLNAPKDKKYIFVYDLGGGSTEITLATNEDNPQILATVSIPLGARNATEMYSLRNYNYKRGKALRNAVNRYMDKFLKEIKDIDYKDNVALVATSSTPLRLVAAIAKMPKYDKFAADGMSVSIDKLNETITSMLKMSYKDIPKVYEVECSKFCDGYAEFGDLYAGKTIEEAIEKWNTEAKA
jgi:exopolyphosphatase/guanosine-5'-triphosphate,3'-diphosphate pyrophosphatase